MSLQQTLDDALAHHHAGRLAVAEALYRQILAQSPDHPAATQYLGVILGARGQTAAAIELVNRSLSLKPDDPEAYANLCQLYWKTKQWDAALQAVQRALQLRPNYLLALYNLGVVYQAMGRLDDAIDAYNRTLAVKPTHVSAQMNLAVALGEANRLDQSIDVCRRILQAHPNHVPAHVHLGQMYRRTGELEASLASLTTAIRLQPNLATAHNDLGTTLQRLHNIDAAAAEFEAATRCDPDYSPAWNNLANVLAQVGRLDESLAAYDHAIALNPSDPTITSNRIFTRAFDPRADDPTLLTEARQWEQRYAPPPLATRNSQLATSSRPRIAYLSSHFRTHCQSVFTIPILSHHDHQSFEIFCYSSVLSPDELTRRIQSCADQWRDISMMTDTQAADLIRKDGIDILVDLTMHMAQNRLTVFAQKPAPIQVAWLAYPGTTGLSAMDYRLTDPYLDPPGENDAHYSERSIRLPDTFWCYDPLATQPDVNDLPALKNGYITFGCLNNFCKINAPTLDLWASVLFKLPTSQLLLLAPPGRAQRAVLDHLKRHRIDPSRIEFVPFQPRPAYLATYHRIDICLDPIPYNGHTTSLDAFWMGVPVITRIGNRVVGRGGWSQLCNLNLRDLAAHTDRDFVSLAASLSADLSRLADLRKTLRQRMLSSPLMDAPRFARGVEAAYRLMWSQMSEKS